MRILSPSADIRRRKNCSENEASNWTPGGHIRARGDRRRTRERRERRRQAECWKESEKAREEEETKARKARK